MTWVAAGPHVSRRTVLTGALAGVAGAGIGTGATALVDARAVPGKPMVTPFYGTHQSGIVTEPLPYLSLAGFDVVSQTRSELANLMRTWTRTAAELTSAGELTVTFGFGPSLFTDSRFGLAGQFPAALTPLPPFAGESLEQRASDGALCVQACATSPTGAHQAVRTLCQAARPQAALRWRQTGFRAQDATADPPGMFGFRDGTANLDVADAAATARHLWVGDGPSWLHAGTYLVVRRIRLLLDTWDRTDVAAQEAIIGRTRETNVRIDTAAGSHVALARPENNGGATLLRRSFSYDAGADPNGLLDSGLIFMCFQQDPRQAFVPIQRRLAGTDSLGGFSQHVASGLFAVPPGCAEDSWIGEELLS